MRKISIFLPEEAAADLAAICRRLGVTQSAQVRALVEMWAAGQVETLTPAERWLDSVNQFTPWGLAADSQAVGRLLAACPPEAERSPEAATLRALVAAIDGAAGRRLSSAELVEVLP